MLPDGSPKGWVSMLPGGVTIGMHIEHSRWLIQIQWNRLTSIVCREQEGGTAFIMATVVMVVELLMLLMDCDRGWFFIYSRITGN